MKIEQENRINSLRKTLNECKIVIEKCNQEIEDGSLQLDGLNKAQYDAIAERGRNAYLKLEQLKKKLKEE